MISEEISRNLTAYLGFFEIHSQSESDMKKLQFTIEIKVHVGHDKMVEIEPVIRRGAGSEDVVDEQHFIKKSNKSIQEKHIGENVTPIHNGV